MTGKTNSNSGVNLDIMLLGESLINSFIRVIYPEGSVCTLTNGTTSITAPNTCGAVAFAIPTTGEWTVSCTNGTKTSSKTITVIANTIYDAILSYEIIFVQNGILQAPNDWSYFGTGYFTGVAPTHSQQSGYYSMSVVTDGATSRSGAAVYNYPLNINTYSHLEVTGQVWGSDASNARVNFVLSTTSNGNPDWSVSGNTHIAHHSVAGSTSLMNITNTVWDLSGGGYPNTLYLMVYFTAYPGYTSSGIYITSLRLS